MRNGDVKAKIRAGSMQQRQIIDLCVWAGQTLAD
jgi:hypothetical protein